MPLSRAHLAVRHFAPKDEPSSIRGVVIEPTGEVVATNGNALLAVYEAAPRYEGGVSASREPSVFEDFPVARAGGAVTEWPAEPLTIDRRSADELRKAIPEVRHLPVLNRAVVVVKEGEKGGAEEGGAGESPEETTFEVLPKVAFFTTDLSQDRTTVVENQSPGRSLPWAKLFAGPARVEGEALIAVPLLASLCTALKELDARLVALQLVRTAYKESERDSKTGKGVMVTKHRMDLRCHGTTVEGMRFRGVIAACSGEVEDAPEMPSVGKEKASKEAGG